ncbi:MAG TPA: trypsin-like peptidase domain-containing protein [Tepidisphaeraceae bacterium]|nr:trypsin-like peptidase domain-containing protein [Tepidisphaeraceae bacterium]
MGSFLRRTSLLGFTAAVLSLSSLPRTVQPQPAIAADIPSDRAVVASETIDLAGLQSRFEEIAKSISPAVVAISASVADTNSDDALRSEEMNAPKLEHILDHVVRTVGTGFVIDPAGYILTNEHVVTGSDCLWITTDSGKVYPAIVIGSDPRADLAVLKVPAANLPTVKFAPTDSVRRGQWTIALGNPYGLAGSGEMSMSVGVVSALDRSLPKLASKENRLYSNLIQTTAEINPGNSGGPLFDIAGQVIGINTAVILPQKQTNGIGFALPVTSRLLDVVQQLKAGNEIPYAYLGVTVVTPTDKERRTANITSDIGARVESVDPAGPASTSLHPEDIITSLNDTPIRDGNQFVRLISQSPASTPIHLTLSRNGSPLTIPMTLAQRDLPSVAITRQSQRLRWRGMLLGPIPAHWTGAKDTTPPEGLLVLNVEKDSPADKQGITPGSLIKTIASQPISSIPDLQRLLNDTPPELCKFQASPISSTPIASISAAPEH